MNKRKSTPADAANLRARAESHLRQKSSRCEAKGHGTADETQRVVHELQVHQIELELQNEELQKARAESEAGLKRYSNLYDFAPMGYLTLDCDGAIQRVNVTGVPRQVAIRDACFPTVATIDSAPGGWCQRARGVVPYSGVRQTSVAMR